MCCAHATGGLTLNDFILAAKLDQIEVEYSPKWLKAQQALKEEGRAAEPGQASAPASTGSS